MKAQRLELKETISNHEVVVGLLKDSGVKSQIVKKYLPAMNKFIRYYLNELDFPIHFQMDSEFNETVSFSIAPRLLLLSHSLKDRRVGLTWH
jgi:hypothetical protein